MCKKEIAMKAIITDLDRTLLYSDKSISDRTLEVLHRCREQGMLLLAASARALRDLQRYHAQIGFDAITATNGAVVLLPDGLVETGIPRESGESILAALGQFPEVTLSLEVGSGLYANRDIPAWKPTVYDGFPKLPDDTILYKILASSQRKELYEGLSGALNGDVYHTIADGNLVQIMSVRATKWSGICKMLARFGVSPAEAVYFGDDNDDIEPLQKCGMGVAVANAIPAVLAAAAYVTSSNDEDGVAAFIETHFLKK